MKPWIRTLALCGALLASWAAPSFAAAAPAASVSAASKADVSALPDATATARPDSSLVRPASPQEEVVDALVRQNQAKSQQLGGTFTLDSLILRVQGNFKFESGTLPAGKKDAILPEETAKMRINLTMKDLTQKSKPVRKKILLYAALQQDTLRAYRQLPDGTWIQMVQKDAGRSSGADKNRKEILNRIFGVERAGGDDANRIYRVHLRNLTADSLFQEELWGQEALASNLTPAERRRLWTAFEGTTFLLTVGKGGYPTALSADWTEGLHRLFDVILENAARRNKGKLPADQQMILLKAILHTVSLRMDTTIGALPKKAPKIPKEALEARVVPQDLFHLDSVPKR